MITTKTKIIAIVAFLAVYGLGCLWLGHRNERLEWQAHVAKMEYERKESEALRQAERLLQEQEKELVAQLEAVRLANADLVADAIRVHEQFDSLRSGRDFDDQSSNYRTDRCNVLLSEAYSLAIEGEGLLRDTRLKALE